MDAIADYPYDLETERLMLSSVLVATPERRDEITARLSPGVFLDPFHARLASVLVEARRMTDDAFLAYVVRRMREESNEPNGVPYALWRMMCVAGAGISGNPANAIVYGVTLQDIASKRRRILDLERQLGEARQDAFMERVMSRGKCSA